MNINFLPNINPQTCPGPKPRRICQGVYALHVRIYTPRPQTLDPRLITVVHMLDQQAHARLPLTRARSYYTPHGLRLAHLQLYVQSASLHHRWGLWGAPTAVSELAVVACYCIAPGGSAQMQERQLLACNVMCCPFRINKELHRLEGRGRWVCSGPRSYTYPGILRQFRQTHITTGR